MILFDLLHIFLNKLGYLTIIVSPIFLGCTYEIIKVGFQPIFESWFQQFDLQLLFLIS